ncbi:hypothetical protein MVEN_01169200 [Mycena venus]|uniref:Uncharacterized protein n=1 Tax=Mycena venus TaxID=2733690 RepID=A0A8H6Y435_9AGAR|nr:hypothetical protein MVEN_01169200 [Mycena venus]
MPLDLLRAKNVAGVAPTDYKTLHVSSLIAYRRPLSKLGAAPGPHRLQSVGTHSPLNIHILRRALRLCSRTRCARPEAPGLVNPAAVESSLPIRMQTASGSTYAQHPNYDILLAGGRGGRSRHPSSFVLCLTFLAWGPSPSPISSPAPPALSVPVPSVDLASRDVAMEPSPSPHGALDVQCAAQRGHRARAKGEVSLPRISVAWLWSPMAPPLAPYTPNPIYDASHHEHHPIPRVPRLFTAPSSMTVAHDILSPSIGTPLWGTGYSLQGCGILCTSLGSC